MKKIEIIPLNNIPKININDDIPSIIIKALKSQKLKLEENDIIEVAQKYNTNSQELLANAIRNCREIDSKNNNLRDIL